MQTAWGGWRRNGGEVYGEEAGRSSPWERKRLEVRARVVVRRPLERGEERRQGRLMEMSKRKNADEAHGEWLTSLSNVDNPSQDG